MTALVPPGLGSDVRCSARATLPGGQTILVDMLEPDASGRLVVEASVGVEHDIVCYAGPRRADAKVPLSAAGASVAVQLVGPPDTQTK